MSGRRRRASRPLHAPVHVEARYGDRPRLALDRLACTRQLVQPLALRAAAAARGSTWGSSHVVVSKLLAAQRTSALMLKLARALLVIHLVVQRAVHGRHLHDVTRQLGSRLFQLLVCKGMRANTSAACMHRSRATKCCQRAPLPARERQQHSTMRTHAFTT